MQTFRVVVFFEFYWKSCNASFMGVVWLGILGIVLFLIFLGFLELKLLFWGIILSRHKEGIGVRHWWER